MPRHVFLSYVRENATVVDRLVKDLQARGVSVWLDRERLLPGQRWRDAIQTAIRGGDLFIACFSAEYLARDRSYMNEELMVAIEELRQRATSVHGSSRCRLTVARFRSAISERAKRCTIYIG